MSENGRSVLFLAVLVTVGLELWGQQLKEVPPNALKRGDHAPPLGFEFVVRGPAPAEVNWKTLHGKVVILDFWVLGALRVSRISPT